MAQALAADVALLERFVACFTDTDPLCDPGEVPPVLRDPFVSADAPNFGQWRPIEYRTPDAKVDALEALLPARFPPLYRLLISRYRYLRIELGNFALLANPPSPGLEGLFYEMFRDDFFSSFLLQHGFIQFAVPQHGNYDPICFNLARRSSQGEMEVVWLDHEQILCYERIRVLGVLAPSFRGLVEQVVAAQ
jgi:hypothetical protein